MASGNLERVFAGWGKEYGASFQRFPYFRRSHSACACFFYHNKRRPQLRDRDRQAAHRAQFIPSRKEPT